MLNCSEYRVKSNVDDEVLRAFVARLWTHKFTVTRENVDSVRAICREFGFSGFDEELKALSAGNACCQERIDRYDARFAEMERLLRDISGRLAHIEAPCAPSHVVGDTRSTDGPQTPGSMKTTTDGEVKIGKYLSEKYRGNPHLRGIVEVTTPCHDLRWYRLIEKKHKHRFLLGSDADNFVQFDFRKTRMCVSEYKLVFHRDDDDPCSFVLEASNDGDTWRVLDIRDCQKAEWGGNNFKCEAKDNVFYRFVRLHIPEEEAGRLPLHHIELMGKIDDSELEQELETSAEMAKPDYAGVFAFLRHLGGGNPHVKGLVEVTKEGTNEEFLHHVLDDDGGCVTGLSSGLQFDFGSSRMCVSGYTLLMDGLARWVVEVSDDQETWEVVDEAALAEAPEEKIVYNSPSVSSPSDVSRRFVRLRALEEIEDCGASISWIDFSGTFEAGDLGAALRVKPPLVGVFEYLLEEFGSDLRGIVQVTASSRSAESQGLVRGLDWWTDDAPESFVQFDFGSSCLRLSAYNLRSFSLLSWVVEVSSDGSTWKVVDERSLEEAPKSPTTFTCAMPAEVFARFVRIRQTGPDTQGENVLCIIRIELFGDLQRS